MVDHFVALPVGQGDAFFVQRGKFTALIDGGRSVQAFSNLFSEVLNRKSVGALVCTHNDADHANGILGFLASGLKCDEVWLPALWADRLDDLLAWPDNFLGELVEDVEQGGETEERSHTEGTTWLDDLDDWYADYGDWQGEHELGDTSPDTLETLIMEDDDGGYEEALWQASLDGGAVGIALVWWPGDYRHRLLLQALSAAQRIRAIATACAHRGVPVRWFRYSSAKARGGLGEPLVPLNAVEVARSRRPVGALRYLALSTSNKLSLAFCSPPGDNWSGVVLTADSDLRFISPIPWADGMIITAPHHGSEANASAYARFSADTNDNINVTWVRSDGNFKRRPGRSYQKQPARYCTLCRAAIRPKQCVRFSSRNGRWKPVASHKCSCT